MSAGCDPGAIPWIEFLFHDCIYNFRDGASFFLGLASIFIWTVAQMPQVIANVRNQSAEGLSIWFLLQWLCGDTLNLLGCLLQGSQLITTTLLAGYFVSSDFLLLSQYYYYEILRPRKPPGSCHDKPEDADAIPSLPEFHEPNVKLQDVPPRRQRANMVMSLDVPSLLPDTAAAAAMAASPFSQPQQPAATAAPRALGGAGGMPVSLPVVVSAAAGASVLGLAAWGLASAHTPGPGSGSFSAAPRYPPYFHFADAAFLGHLQQLPGCNVSSSSAGGSAGGGAVDYRESAPWWCDPEAVKSLVGTIMGYSMTVFYLGSRFPQIYLNWLRQSSEGLCLSMFLLAGTANMCTALSIVLRSRTLEELQDQLPWLLGAVGTIGLDLFILYQGWLYRAGPGGEEVGELEAPLLMEEGELLVAPPPPAGGGGGGGGAPLGRRSLNAHLVAEALLTGHHRPLATLPIPSPRHSPPTSPRSAPPHALPPPTAAVPMSPRFPIFVRSSTSSYSPRGSSSGDPAPSLSRGHSCRTAPQSPKQSWVPRSSSMGHESVPASPSPVWSTAHRQRPARLGQTTLMHHAEEEEGRESNQGSRCSSQLDLRQEEGQPLQFAAGSEAGAGPRGPQAP